MKIFSAVLLTTIIGATLLGGCASPSMSHSSDTMAGMSKSGGDMMAMCDMHKKMMAMSPQDRKAMMDEHMKDMSPEMRAQHMDKMKQCM
ncbi:MAG: hypothetical protein H7327_09405 [Herminiimonas sp.]|nr:hypothetical protein [Herminiimonas sp.]